MSITNFEEITPELTIEELALVPILISGFELHTEKNPIKAPEIISSLRTYLSVNKPGIKIKITEARLRKFVNHIRVNAMLPLIATSKGYYVSWDDNELRMQVKSLQERARSILNAADGLERFIYGKESR